MILWFRYINLYENKHGCMNSCGFGLGKPIFLNWNKWVCRYLSCLLATKWSITTNKMQWIHELRMPNKGFFQKYLQCFWQFGQISQIRYLGNLFLMVLLLQILSLFIPRLVSDRNSVSVSGTVTDTEIAIYCIFSKLHFFQKIQLQSKATPRF